MPLDPRTRKLYDDWGVPPPTSEDHGTPDEIRANLRQATPTNWRQEGNKLICDTEFGTLVNHIPTHYILTATDKAGLPIFKKLL